LFKHQRRFIINKDLNYQSPNDFLDEILQIKHTKPSNLLNRKNPSIEKPAMNFLDETLKTTPNLQNQKSNLYEQSNQASNDRINSYDQNINYNQNPQQTNNLNRTDNVNRNYNNTSSMNFNQNNIRRSNDEYAEGDYNKLKKPQMNFYRDDMSMNLSFKNVLYNIWKN